MLEVIGLEKAFTGDGMAVRAVDGVDFSVSKNESFTLLGASGCGKTTTLRCIAGLEKPSAGIIRIDGREVFNAEKRVFVPPDKRGIGMVFQSYAIWPHMNVFGNAAFPLRIARKKRAEIDERVRWALNMVRLGDLADRPATKLSGGQQQRLAVARALVQEPKLLLLDEPLSNLDAKLREQMRLELKALQSRLGLTMLYVTHDQTEAIVLSDHIAIMREGRIVQRGSPREVYTAPNCEFVADFVGSTNLIHGTVAECLGPTCCRVETAQGMVLATNTGEVSAGQSVVVSVRPESIHLRAEAPEDTDDGTVWEVAVQDHVFLGDATYYAVSWGDRVLRVRSSPHLEIAKGCRAYVRMVSRDCICVPHEEERLRGA